LNFPKVKIKESPSKENSNVKRLGFRSLFKYCYLNQDDVGSKSFLDLGNWGKHSTNKEVFKYIFNVLDSSIAELEVEISEKSKLSERVRKKYFVISEFLKETGYESLNELDEFIESIDSNLEGLKAELKKINTDMVADSKSYSEIKAIFNELVLKEKGVAVEIISTNEIIDKYSRLKNDYDNDISKIKSLKLAKERMGQIKVESSFCPVCDNEIKIEEENIPFQITPTEILEQELNSLIKRRKNIKELLDNKLLKSKDLIRVVF